MVHILILSVISLHEPLQRYHRWSTVLQTTVNLRRNYA